MRTSEDRAAAMQRLAGDIAEEPTSYTWQGRELSREEYEELFGPPYPSAVAKTKPAARAAAATAAPPGGYAPDIAPTTSSILAKLATIAAKGVGAPDAPTPEEVRRFFPGGVIDGIVARVMEKQQPDDSLQLMPIRVMTELFNFVGKRVFELHDALEARIAELEREPFKYVGAYEAGKSYGRRSVMTFGGSLWYAKNRTSGPPPGGEWVLCVNRGRDARQEA